jgi:predicted ATPase/DNA-binding SARP family transcriptional activator
VTAHDRDPVHVYLFGSLEVAQGDRLLRPEGWARRKAATLFARLSYERRLHKEQAIDFLWPESRLPAGANNLYRTLHALRQSLDAALGPESAAAVFSFSDGILRLDDSVWVDVAAFERLAVPVPGDSPRQRIGRLEEALSLYRADFLADDPYAEWTLAPRERLYRQQRDLRLVLASHLAASNSFPEAIALLGPLLNRDPADEQVHRDLMRLYALAGRRDEALRQYQLCVDALAAELAVEPAEETSALHRQILDGELRPAPGGPGSLNLEPTAARYLASIPPAPTTGKPRPLFVGRERELSWLQFQLDAAVAGDGGVFFVTGEAGHGKTSLMTEFAYRAARDHSRLVVSAGSCQALMGIADPYLPFRDLMAMLAGDWQRPWPGGEIPAICARRLEAIGPQTVQAIDAHASALVDVIVPAALLPAITVPGVGPLNQDQLFEQTRQLLHLLSRQQPLLLLLDDLQWADTASANLLFYLGRQLANSAVLVIGAYRPSEVEHDGGTIHPLAPVVQELVRHRGDIQIDLRQFTPAEGRRFVDALLDSEPNRLDAAFREAMFQQTRGHPLFTVELLRALQEQADIARDESGLWSVVSPLDWEILPARVEAVIARRIDRLPPESRRLLAISSVEGESFTVEVVSRVATFETGPLLELLAQKLDRQFRLVREQGEASLGGHLLARYQFRHNLFQQYLYRQLGGAEKRYLHARVAGTLEELAGPDRDSVAGLLAQHYLAAGDTTRAVPLLHHAGDDARRRVAIDEAVQFYRLALAHWQDGAAVARAALEKKLGESLLTLGQSQEAIDHLAAAERLFAAAGNRAGQGAALRLIGRSYWEQGARGPALHHYHQALALLEQEPESAELARAIAAIAQMHVLADAYDEAIAWGERALALARRLQVEDVRVHALTTLGISRVDRGQAERGLAMLAESQARAEALGLPHDTCRAIVGLGDSLLRLERYEEARSAYEQLLAYARKVGAEMFEGVALAHLGYVDWWTGQWRAALARQQAITGWMARSALPSVSKIWASNLLGEMYNDLGQPEHARAMLAPYTALARSADEPQTTVLHLGELARAAHEEPERAALLEELLALVDAAPRARHDTVPALRRACIWRAQNSAGDRAALSPLAQAHEQLQSRLSAASLTEAQAVAAGVRGEWAQAVSYFQESVAQWAALRRPLDQLRALSGLGGALVKTGDSATLDEVRRQARGRIAELAAELGETELGESFLRTPLVRTLRP